MDKVKDDLSDELFGCPHYRRQCKLIAPCCGKAYICRLCHDEGESHEMNRHDVKEIECLSCETRQEPCELCSKCGIKFASYYCEICHLYDNQEKGQFHCKNCGICRVGGAENFIHCDRCGICLSAKVKDTHKCIENSSKSNCPVCLDDLHTSRIGFFMPPCGHLLHSNCYHQMLENSNFTCPVCNLSMLNMKPYWEHMDQEIQETPMPDEYKTKKVQILCCDCQKESRVLFHILGLKCSSCGSYNTCRTAEKCSDEEWETDEEVDTSSQLENISSQLENASSQLENASSQLDNASSQLDNASSQLDNVPSQLDNASSHLNALSMLEVSHPSEHGCHQSE